MGRGGTSFSLCRDGSAKRIIKPGQIFSRIHVEDIAGVLAASIAKPHPGRAYNVCDDEPCPPQEVVAYAANLLGLPVPPEIPFEEAELSPMAKSFYAESKRVSNRRIKTELGYKLIYPNYRDGLCIALEPSSPSPLLPCKSTGEGINGKAFSRPKDGRRCPTRWPSHGVMPSARSASCKAVSRMRVNWPGVDRR